MCSGWRGPVAEIGGQLLDRRRFVDRKDAGVALQVARELDVHPNLLQSWQKKYRVREEDGAGSKTAMSLLEENRRLRHENAGRPHRFRRTTDSAHGLPIAQNVLARAFDMKQIGQTNRA